MTKHLINSTTNRPWTFKEVEHTLRTRNLKEREANERACVYDCLEEHPFGNYRAKLSVNYEGEWDYFCVGCRNEGIWDGLERVQSWLNSLNLDAQGLKPHYNPMDTVDVEASLGLFFDTAGRGVLYKGLIHFLYGKPGTLKSWLALSLVQNCETRFWDFENGVSVTGSRLRALETPIEKAAVFDSPATKDGVRARVKQYVKSPPELLVIDGFSGLAGVLGVDPDSNQDVLSVFTDIFAPLRRAGVTVLVLDHLPKDLGVEDYPIGAQAKKSQSDVTLLVRDNKRSSTLDVMVTKDRVGKLSQRCEEGPYPKLLGRLSLDDVEGRAEVKLDPYRSARLGPNEIQLEAATLMQAIWNHVQENPDCTQTQIEESVRGRRDTIRETIEGMVRNGFVARKQVGRTFAHSVAHPLVMEYTLKD
jgi:hypothetical protein